MPEGVDLGDVMPEAAIGMHQGVAACRRRIREVDALCCGRGDGRCGLPIPEIKAGEEGDPLGIERPRLLSILLIELFEVIRVVAGHHCKGFHVGSSPRIPTTTAFFAVYLGAMGSETPAQATAFPLLGLSVSLLHPSLIGVVHGLLMLAVEKAAQQSRARADRGPQPRIAGDGADERTTGRARSAPGERGLFGRAQSGTAPDGDEGHHKHDE
jgi:hypothetical protein